MGTSILGNRVQRVEDERMLTVGGQYVEDLALDGSAWLTYVRSTEAHARIVAIDVDEARAAPGVLAVFTGEDLAELGLAPNLNPSFHDAMRRPYVAAGTVRYVGQPVVAVLAEDRYLAADAAELVVVDYEPLPVVVDPEEGIRDEVLLFPEAGTNIVQRWEPKSLADFSDCEVVRVFATSRDGTKVPLNILKKKGTVLNGNKLKERGLTGLADVVTSVPNVSFTSNRDAAQLYIRGIGKPS